MREKVKLYVGMYLYISYDNIGLNRVLYLSEYYTHWSDFSECNESVRLIALF